jgi:hypothetical protein
MEAPRWTAPLSSARWSTGNGRNEAVALSESASMNRGFAAVPQNSPNLADRLVDGAIEVDKSAVRPDRLYQLIPRHNLAGKVQ